MDTTWKSSGKFHDAQLIVLREDPALQKSKFLWLRYDRVRKQYAWAEGTRYDDPTWQPMPGVTTLREAQDTALAIARMITA